MSVRQKYQAECTQLNVKCNSAILKQLPEDDGATLTNWDLSGNIVGTRGAVAVLRVAESLPLLKSLNLSNNNLTSPATKDILHSLVNHPSLTSLDLSNNDIRLGGPELVELLKRNRKIYEVNITNTYLRPLFERLIQIQARKNNQANPQVTATVNVIGAGGTGAGPSTGTHAKFSFGTAADDHPSEEAAQEEDPFAKMTHVSFGGGSTGGKKVPRRPTVSAEIYKDDEIDNFKPEVNEKDPKAREWIITTLEKHNLFSHLEDFELAVAADAMMECERGEGGTLYDQNDDENDIFYLLYSGEIELLMNDEVHSTAKRGDTFNDVNLLYPSACKESAKCLTDCVYYTLDRRTYKCVLSKASKKKRAMYEGFLSTVGFLKGLQKFELLQLADALKPANYEAGHSLIKYGETGESFFLIVDGVVEVFGRDEQKNPIKVCEFTKGDCVGELEFINNHKCVADVKAQNFVRTAKMNRHHFEMVMGPVKEVLARTAQESHVYEYYRSQLAQMKDH